jgi:RNA polymerase sigma-70 factor (ECF subfamily)
MSNSDQTRRPAGSPVFVTTRWSVVLAARGGDSSRAAEALERLCEAYWYPLYAFVRRKGLTAEAAQDLVQEFFARLLETNWLENLDREKGRFRAFLLASVQNLLGKEVERAQAIKRGGGCVHFSLDAETAEGRYRLEPAHDATAEKIFERRWALALLEQALAALKHDYVQADKAALFEALQGCLSGEENTESYAELGARLGMSEGAARVAVHRLRRRYGELLRAEIAHTVARPEEVEAELRHLRVVLSG